MAKKVVKEVAVSMEERLHEIDKCVASINDAFKKDQGIKATALKKTLKEAVDTYNEILRHQEYDKFLADFDNCVLNALLQGDITQLVIKQGVVKDTDIQCVEIDSRQVLVDLKELDEYSGRHGAIFESGQWIYKIEAFAKVLTERIAKDVENKEARADVVKNLRLSDAAQQVEGVKDPLSNKSLKVQGQQICDDILAGYTFKGKDLNYLLLTMTRQSGKARATLVAPRVGTVVKLFTEMMHAMVCEKQYGVEFKKAEK